MPFLDDDLEAIERYALMALCEAARRPKAPFRVLTLASLNAQGLADARSLVVRDVVLSPPMLTFHTDLRSRKIEGLKREPRVTLIGFDAANGTELRLRGLMRIETIGMRVDAVWNGLTANARKTYGVTPPPGHALPQGAREKHESLNSARENFALLSVLLTSLEVYRLDGHGHRRARFSYGEEAAPAVFLVP